MKSGLLMLSSLALAFSISACSSSSEETPDAAPDGSGGGGKAAEVVTCTAAATKEIKTQDVVGGENNKYYPAATTVSAGTVVKFTMVNAHNARSTTGLFLVDYGQTACVKFNNPGTYSFGCTPHGFVGTVTVQ